MYLYTGISDSLFSGVARLFGIFSSGKPGESEDSPEQNRPEPSGDQTSSRIRISSVKACCADLSDASGVSESGEICTDPRGLLAVIADGKGSSEFAEAAVREALSAFQSGDTETNDEGTLLRILYGVKEKLSSEDLKGEGTSFLAAFIHENKLHFISVGSGRIYLLRGGGLIQLNRDHVLPRNLDGLLEKGHLIKDEAALKSMITGTTELLGTDKELTPDRNINPIPLYKGDKLILVSDGVYNAMADVRLKTLLLKNGPEAVQDEILAKNDPPADDLTILVLEVEK